MFFSLTNIYVNDMWLVHTKWMDPNHAYISMKNFNIILQFFFLLFFNINNNNVGDRGKKKEEKRAHRQNSWSLKFEYIYILMMIILFSQCKRFMWERQSIDNWIPLLAISVTIDRIWKFGSFDSFGRSRYSHITIFSLKIKRNASYIQAFLSHHMWTRAQ